MIRAADISTEMPAFVPCGDKYAAQAEILVELSTVPHVRHSIWIPQGYEFDGASIPRCCWALIGSPFEPDLMLAACAHDWYCEHTAGCYESRVIGDAVFFLLLQRAGVPRWRRIALYLGVRLYSFWVYGRKAT